MLIPCSASPQGLKTPRRPYAAFAVALVGILVTAGRPAQGPVLAQEPGQLQRMEAQLAQTGDIDPQAVKDAIAQGVRYLKSKQLADGTWRNVPELQAAIQLEGGATSLCTLALLNCGLTAEDPAVARALTYLREQEFEFNYAIALQTMVFCAAQPERDLLLIQRNAKQLLENQLKSGTGRGGWNYKPGAGLGDNSNAQFAVLALYEAERTALRYGDTSFVTAKDWESIVNFWDRQQWPEGAWSYPYGARSFAPTGSMTCAGLASLIMAADILDPPDAEVRGDQVICCGNQKENEPLKRGFEWIARYFSVTANPGGSKDYYFYYLYALERVGRLTNNRFIGGRDWFREGSFQLLVRHAPDRLEGYWRGEGHGEDAPEVATALALLFLSKGRRPVVMAKLKTGENSAWNSHRHDAGNLTAYAEIKWKKDLTWQTMDASRVEKVEDLLQTPVLFISGSAGMELTPAFAKLVRDYLDRGGFLFAEACCEEEAFDRNFRSFMEQVFPEPEYRLRPLEPTHPVWRAEEPVPLELAPPLWGLDAGCRTAVVYCPQNLGCYWELMRGRGNSYSAKVQAQIHAARAVGINVLAYATNREVKFKDEIPTSVASTAVNLSQARGTLSAAKIRHPGGCDAAPLAMGNLIASLGENLGMPVNPQVPLISLGDPALYQNYLVFMHGRNSFRFSDQEREHLRTFVERGGVLIADSICGSEAFAESLRAELKLAFPANELQRIPADHPLFTDAYGGTDVRTLSRRKPDPNAEQGIQSTRINAPPELEGILIGKRYGVIFSRFDISCALENKQSLECPGYDRTDAAKLAVNLVLYAMQE